ncbi:tetratricopeptide repeat protein [Nitratidesulfovibrio liaohensis]|uniref:Tetratricopeptide repeat protein n=1 Tax=Nitratidesulfovibrio liaohensis TaxID=2604158 RepID=A0ABY9R3F8_9BACT|nr:tetratricopeptide repeat protein [Nitratidesulfovibrio liaohensis]WMW65989.1 tetratricopeptide repeat protein [Nitratidesulfovibrio liaohensis]
MKAKIEWYQEVLELEPSSKVFFPLARLLAENGQPDDAIATLRQGLDRHPEFIEARLFLIELLHSSHRDDLRDGEVGKLARLLGAYPGFWDAWSACLAAGDKGRDTALALAFLAASFRSGTQGALSWTSVIEHGLRAMLGGNGTEPAAMPAASPASSLHVVAPSSSAMPEMPDEPALADGYAAARPDTRTAPAAVGTGGVADASGAPEAIDTQDEEEEHFSLRTRSMAQVLAEQGDLRGALDIYEELMAASGSDEERADIAGVIQELTNRLKSAGEGSQRQQAADEGQPLRGKHKLIHMLESLAERLEARAQG